ncbi:MULTISPECIES: porin family protein [unclassified Bacteroides]|uniref:porin family protein n=1 Tax=unclassified Bacteroides TaxID=2646097 RepID=UPI0004E22FFB|nr:MULTISPECIES: porin family protein [unclassified Bacteroides]
MKNKHLLPIIVALMPLMSNAQSEVGSLNIQPKIGLNIATMPAGDAKSRKAFAAGVEAEYFVHQSLSLSVGAIYSQQGFRDSKEIGITDMAEPDADCNFILDYINIPIMANIYASNGLAVKAGIQPGFRIRSKFKLTADGTTINADNFTRNFDLAIPLGVSYEFNNLQFDIRYNIGITNATRDKYTESGDAKNRVVQISLGYKFWL